MIYRFSFLFALFSLLIFSACHDMFAPPKPENIPVGKGSFSLSVAVGRTILPDTPREDALWYRFDFTPSPTGAAVQEDRDYTGLADPVYLDAGTYSLAVTAYSDAGRTNLVVRGNSVNDIVIVAGESTGASIVLTAIIGSGTGSFTYIVGIPASVSSAALTITPLGVSSPIIDDPRDRNSGEGTYNLATGYYNVRFTLVKENGDTLEWPELLHIYANLESVFAMEFMDADFYKTICTVTFEYNDGRPNGVGSVLHGGKAIRPAQDPTRENYTFGGWYSDSDLTKPYDFETPVISDIPLYAKWDQNPGTADITINVEQIADLSFDDIDGGIIYRNANPSSISFEYNDDDTDSYSCEWTIDGVGAYAGLIPLSDTASCTVDATDPQYNSLGRHPVYLKVVKDDVPYKKTIWVTIMWGDIFTVSFDTNGGSPTPAQDIIEGGKATRPENPTMSAFGFVDWYDNEGLADPHYDFNTPVTGNITLYAKWSNIFHTVSFNSNGGSPVDSQEIAEGGRASRPTPYPTKEGYAFGGWYSNSVLTALYDFNTPVTGTITLYARWKESTDDDKADFGEGATIHDIFTVSTIEEWNAAKAAIKAGGDNKNYVINVLDGVTIPVTGSTISTSYTFGNASGIKVSLRGEGTLALSGTGRIVNIAADQTLILRDLTLQGNAGNTTSLVFVRGTFDMHSGTITGNTASQGGGVYFYGTFTMYGGTISGNKATSSGGGVFMGVSGTFTMHGGTISGNTTSGNGGGVYVASNGTFTMHSGTISGNTASSGGGVYATSTFRLITGTIYGSNEADTSLRNKASSGAALYVSAAVSSNTAQRGTFAANGTTWSSKGNLSTTANTIRVVEGVLQ
jgi:uncharacterized repeat protein (TIGR02543 family)